VCVAALCQQPGDVHMRFGPFRRDALARQQFLPGAGESGARGLGHGPDRHGGEGARRLDAHQADLVGQQARRVH
jgi:hypothetical protein